MNFEHGCVTCVFREVGRRPLRTTSQHTPEKLVEMRDQANLVALDMVTGQTLPQRILAAVIVPVYDDRRIRPNVRVDQASVEMAYQRDSLPSKYTIILHASDHDASIWLGVVARDGCVDELAHQCVLCDIRDVAVELLCILVA